MDQQRSWRREQLISSLLLGQTRSGLPIVYPGNENALFIAKPRSGKSRGICIPNLIRYPGSILVANDPKGELAAATAQYRYHVLGQKTWIIDPFGTVKDPWIPTFRGMPLYGAINPIDFIRKSHSPLTAAFQIAAALIPVGETREPHWPNGAQLLLVAILLFVALDPVVERNATRDMDTVWAIISDPKTRKAALKAARNSTDFVVKSQADAFYNLAPEDREKSGIKSHLDVSLTKVLGEPKILSTMLGSNIDFSQMAKETDHSLLLPPGKSGHAFFIPTWLP